MYKLIIDLRSSFWFLPAVVAFAAAALALMAVELDARVGSEALARYPRLFGAGAEGTRQLLSAIASSTITVAGVVFSITIVALSLAAAQYSPRVLRGFMRDRANQLVLGIFLGIYVYCLLVLRTIRGGEAEFVPGLSMLGAIVLALVGIGFLIFFIHHIATSIQVSEIAARVTRETLSAIEKQFGKAADRPRRERQPPADVPGPWYEVAARDTGYIQSIDHHRLLGHARASGGVVRMVLAPGDFVVRGEVLLCVSTRPSEEEAVDLNRGYAVNTYRDVAQDAAFGVQQLVDIALKALSPGVNDTATARTCLDYLTAILLELLRHDISEEERFADDDGRLLLIARHRSLEYYIASTFEAIRRNSTHNVDMLLHALQAVERVARGAGTQACRSALALEIAAVREAVGGARYGDADTRKLADGMERASAALARS